MLSFISAPVPDYVTGPFGADWKPWSPYSPHRGVDYGSYYREFIAPAAGISVPFTNNPGWWNGQYVPAFGTALCLDHGESAGEFRYTLYAHLSQLYIPIGTHVSAGQVCGVTGETGMANGAHIHWQLCKNTYFPTDIRYSDDPTKYITGEEDLTEDQVRDIIHEMQGNGELASTSDILACVAQIVGSEDCTYSDTDRVNAVREVLGVPLIGEENDDQ